tara:strand:+ start:149 stop:658 length:510 start_codon:yes stop_codon:yes gene_type:complete
MIQEENFKALCSLATRVIGLNDGALAFKNRSKHIQSARASVCYIALTEENIDRNIIAKILKKNRTATYHYQVTHKKKFKKCDVYRNTFTKIYQEYKSLEGEKDIFKNGGNLHNFLLNNNVVESDKSDVTLEVKSGEATCFIKTSYFDYLNQLKNISLALENYHYNVKII